MLCAACSLEFFKSDWNIAPFNKDSSQKDILDDGINILAVNAYMSELTNATMIRLRRQQKIPRMINIPRPITKVNRLHCNTVQVGSK